MSEEKDKKESIVLIDGVEKKNVFVNGAVKKVSELTEEEFSKLKSDWKKSKRKLEIK